MMKKHLRTPSTIGFSDFEADLATSLLPLSKLDSIIVEKQAELTQISDPYSNTQRDEDKELEKIDKIINSPPADASMAILTRLLQNSQFQLVKSRVSDYFMSAVIMPNELIDTRRVITKNSVQIELNGLIVFTMILSELPNAFPFFTANNQSEILEGFANMLVLLAPDPKHLKQVIPFQTYLCAANACLKILEKCFEINLDNNIIEKYVIKVLSMVITIAENISLVVRETKTRLPSHAGYVGELLPFAAAIEPLKPQSNENILRLLQQYWIILIIFSYNNTTVFFSQWPEPLDTLSRYMPPLVHNAARGNFASIKLRVQELLNLIQPMELKTSDDLVQTFTKLLPAIPSKTILSLELADAVCILSIYVLEELRAEHGIFGPIFVYIEGECPPTFSFILDAMFAPIYNVFKKAIEDMSDYGRRMKYINYAMTILLQRYTSNVPRIQTCVDQLFSKFTQSNPVVFTDLNVIDAYAKSQLLLHQTTQIRQQDFNNTIIELFSFSTQRIPYAFFASLAHYLENNADSNFKNNQPSFLPYITQKLPIAFREVFINEFLLKNNVAGQARFATIEKIREIENVNDRLLLLSSFISLHPDTGINYFDELMIPAPQHTLMLAWSDVAMSSQNLGKCIVRKMVNYFNTTARSRIGIFASELNVGLINLQASIIRFLIEQVTSGFNPGLIGQVLVFAADVQLLYHPAIVSALYPLAFLGCIIIQSGINLSAPSKSKLKSFILTLVFTAHSFVDNPLVFKFIDKVDLVNLEMLVSVISDVSKISLQTGEQFSMSNSMSLSNVSKSSYSRGRVPRIIAASNSRAQQNFLSSIAAESQIEATLYSIASFLLCSQLQLFTSYILPGKISASVQRLLALNQMKKSTMRLATTLPIIWSLAPGALYPICNIPLIGESAISIVAQLVEKDIFSAARVPEIALLFNRSDRFNRNDLSIWKPINPLKAFSLLTPEIMKERGTASYVVRCFEQFQHEEGLLYIPQLVQALRFDACGVLRDFLIRRSQNDEVFCHYLLWNLLGEKDNMVSQLDNLPAIAIILEQEIISSFNEEQLERYHQEFGLIEELDVVSQRLLNLDIPNRPPALFDMLKEMHLSERLYIPSNPQYKILSIDAEHSVPLKSHARVPILVRFSVYDEHDEEKKPIPFSCIFKIHDDVRQDAMMIQFIDCFKSIFNDAAIDCFLFPYRVFSTGSNRGVIECIPNSKSRHDIGQSTDEDLLKYFINKYGQVGTPAFQKAQSNFIKSVAPYSLICYLFEVKDRHNANIMLDEDGHVIHIDFGFIFEISPGGVQFELAPFKLTKEMVDVMGGSKEAQPFQEFVKLMTRCFFAVRSRHEEIEAIADLMRSAGFPCFRADSIKKLRQRFCVDMSPKEVVQTVSELINSSYEAMSTIGYDAFQATQNRIFF